MTEISSAAVTSSNTSDSKVIAELEQRIVALEAGAKYDINKEAIEKIEMNHLHTLREIRTAIINEQLPVVGKTTTMNSVTTAMNGDSSNNTVQQQQQHLESLQKENDILKKKMMKLEYRIQHLVSNMEVLYNTQQ